MHCVRATALATAGLPPRSASAQATEEDRGKIEDSKVCPPDGTLMNTLDRLLARARRSLTRLQPHQAREAVQSGAILVDIRPEFQRRADGEIPGAVVVERNHLEWRLHPESSARIAEAVAYDVYWIVICDEGYSSSLAAATLHLMGLRKATDVVEGFQAWRAAGLPVNPPGELTPPRLAPTEPSSPQGRQRASASLEPRGLGAARPSAY